MKGHIIMAVKKMTLFLLSTTSCITLFCGCSQQSSPSISVNTISIDQSAKLRISDLSISNNSVSTDSVSANSVSTNSISADSVSTNFVSDEAASDRVTYQDGFFYESISDDVKKRIYGLSYKKDCTVPYEELRYLNVDYIDFNGNKQTGEIICNKSIAQDLVEIFYDLYIAKYPIDKIALVDEYQADDDLSCLADNTSCFNFRSIDGTSKISNHAKGLAIDVNPLYNPYVKFPDGIPTTKLDPSVPYIDRSLSFPHKIDENDLCYNLFTAYGFTWGGAWNSVKDYQHFEK